MVGSFVFLVSATLTAQDFKGYYRYPDIHGNKIVFTAEGGADTLKTYVGNATWMDGNNGVKFEDDAWTIGQVGGYYILWRDENQE